MDIFFYFIKYKNQLTHALFFSQIFSKDYTFFDYLKTQATWYMCKIILWSTVWLNKKLK